MCIFCDIAKHTLDANIVYEDDLITAFLDSNPINEGHILIKIQNEGKQKI